MTAVGLVLLGACNRRSITRALERAGARVMPVERAAEIARCDALVIPGVAHFGYIAGRLDALALREPLREAAAQGMPMLGICAGYHLFFDGSDEAPQARGLGLFAGRVERLALARTPHMGWNRVGERDWAYFAHAYAPPASVPDASARTREADTAFAAIAQRGALCGVQFHPERSGAYGAELLRAFVASGSMTYAG